MKKKIDKKPSVLGRNQSPRWGGYQITFKIISQIDYQVYESNLDALRMRAETVGPAEQRKFKIDISKFEFCLTKLEAELDDHTVYVYSLSMMAFEKLRAICQQMPEYELRSYATPRARDFLDIFTIANAGLARIVSHENMEVLRNIFAAKEVPISLLDRVMEVREFHRPDWDAVRQTSSDDLEEFDFYFDYVVGMIEQLKALGIEDPPA